MTQKRYRASISPDNAQYLLDVVGEILGSDDLSKLTNFVIDIARATKSIENLPQGNNPQPPVQQQEADQTNDIEDDFSGALDSLTTFDDDDE
ncbi:MAG: hypothetical protein ACFE0I_02440 [Elainellaceae cyanobacterium]